MFSLFGRFHRFLDTPLKRKNIIASKGTYRNLRKLPLRAQRYAMHSSKKLETSKKFYDIHEINLEKLKKLSPTGFLIN